MQIKISLGKVLELAVTTDAVAVNGLFVRFVSVFTNYIICVALAYVL